MKRFLALALCLLLLPICAWSEETDMDAQTDAIFRKFKTTGGAVVVLKDGERVYERYYGVKNKNAQTAVDENTYFRLASVTKMVSGIGAMQLCEKGLLSLDASIGDTLGFEVINPYAPDIPVTLRMLMTHTAAFKENGGFASQSRSLSSILGDRNNRWGNFEKRASGAQYVYSNFGAGTVGAMMEAVTGQSVNAYMQENVFEPLGIEAAYAPSLLSSPEDVASLYTAKGTLFKAASAYLRETYEDYADPEYHFRTTIGALWMRPRDLATVTQVLCDGGAANGVQILSEETVELMRADQTGIGNVYSDEYGLFIKRVPNLLEGRMVYGHQGTSEGIVCNAYYIPEERFVFVLLTNGTSSARNDAIMNIARQMFALMYDAFGA